MRIPNTFFFVLIFSAFVFGQVKERNDDRGFEVPAGQISVLLVNDPKSPVQLSGPTKVIGWSSGGLLLGFNIQNVSDSNVDSFVVEETDWVGGRGYNCPFKMKKNIFFVPLMTFSSLYQDEDAEDLVAFEEQKAGKTILHWSNKIWLAMVVKAKLSDGTTYDASKKYNALKKFIDDQDENPSSSLAVLAAREQKLRQFVSNLIEHR